MNLSESYKKRLQELSGNMLLIPKVLYHATYEPLIEKIEREGLGSSSSYKNFDDSKKDVVYLARDKNVASSYAEISENVPDEWLNKIIILEIDASGLEENRLKRDENVRFEEEPSTFEYEGVIAPNLIKKI